MAPDTQSELEDRLRRALRSSLLPASLTSHERLAQLRMARRGHEGDTRKRVTPIHAMAGLGSVTAIAVAAILSMNSVGNVRGVPTDGGASAARSQPPASEPAGSLSVEAVYEVDTYNFGQESRLARISGRLGGQLVGHIVCLWIEDAEGVRNGLVLQAGSVAQLDPLRLVGPDGHVVAIEGDLIKGAGGNDDQVSSACEGLVSGTSSMVGVVNLSTEGTPEN